MSHKFVAQRLLLIIFLLTALSLSTTPARADIAPPALPPGVTILPGEELTQVRMQEERVVFEIQPSPAGLEPFPYGGGEIVAQALVTATFTMRNLGNQAESMAVRFPLDTWVMNYDEATMPEVDDFQAEVVGNPVETRHIQSAEPVGEWSQAIDWAEFSVTFPPGQDVIIEVTYTVDATAFTTQGGEQVMNFDYILETGAGWKDTIGKVEVLMHMPYTLGAENVLGYGESYTDFTIEEDMIRWYYENLEPTREDNISVYLVSLPAWQAVLDARQAAQEDPRDGEVWCRLGDRIQDVMMSHHFYRTDSGAESLFSEDQQAYERCLELLPDDSLGRYNYARLLWNFSEAKYDEGGGGDTAKEMQALRELQLAMQLDPENEDAFRMLCWIHNQTNYITGCTETCFSDCNFNQMVFRALTMTPTSIIQPSTTPTPEPSVTLSPLSSATVVIPLPSDTSEPTASLPTTQPVPSPSAPPEIKFLNQTCPSNVGFLLVLVGAMVLLKKKS